MKKDKPIGYDLDGYNVVKDAVLAMINQSPLLKKEGKVSFGMLEKNRGFAIMPTSSSVVESRKKDVTGKITEICYYPFALVYRDTGMNEKRKSEVTELLDNMGKWLEKQEITIDGVSQQLEEYPELTDNRMFLEVKRQTNSYLAKTYEDRAEDWEILITARYKNEYRL